jgi:hypothetical protein
MYKVPGNMPEHTRMNFLAYWDGCYWMNVSGGRVLHQWGHIVCGTQHHREVSFMGLNIHGTEIPIAKSQVRRHRSGTL